jgi:glycosyltransferase involved in cell wall biosynthesis
MKPPKIRMALISSSDGWGDSEQVLWELGMGLHDSGHEIRWACRTHSELFHRAEAYGFFVCPISMGTTKLTHLARLRNACIQAHVQVTIANDSHASVWSSLALIGKRGIKRLQYKHDCKPPVSSLPYRLLDSLVCASDSVQEVCIDRGIEERKLAVIEPGVAPSLINRSHAKEWACRVLHIPSQTPLFCSVGELHGGGRADLKSHSQMIETANHLRWHMMEFCIVMLSDASITPELKRLTREYSLENHVRFVRDEHWIRWIAASDAIVQHTPRTSYSLATMHAEMTGTVVIATGNPTGEPIGDPATLASSMTTVTRQSEESQRTAQRAKKAAIERYHSNGMVQKFQFLLLNTLGIELPIGDETSDTPIDDPRVRRAG